MTIPGTLATPEHRTVVCLFKVDGNDHVYEYRDFGSETVARHVAAGAVEAMHAHQNGTRSVSIQRDDGSWETIGCYYDIRRPSDVEQQ